MSIWYCKQCDSLLHNNLICPNCGKEIIRVEIDNSDVEIYYGDVEIDEL